MNQSDTQTTYGQLRCMAQMAPMSPPAAHLTVGERDTQGHFCQPSSEYMPFPNLPQSRLLKRAQPGQGQGASHGGVSRGL